MATGTGLHTSLLPAGPVTRTIHCRMGRIGASFVVVGVLAIAARWQFGSDEMFKRTAEQVSEETAVEKGQPDMSYHAFVPPLGGELAANASVRQVPELPSKAQHLSAILDQVTWVNGVVEPFIPASLWTALPRFCQSWLRNYIIAIFVYFGVGFLWAYYIYQCWGGDLFQQRKIPTWSDMGEQMLLAFCGLPFYSFLPTVTEQLVEDGWTLSYGSVHDVGLVRYVMYLFIYMAFVEFGVYWMHRGLHDIPAGYKYLHAVHHKYNKEHTMSPFAGLAFHPIDGILQALPYTIMLFFVPMHFMTHELLLFLTGVWTANIHDNLHGNVSPIMGAGWHTIHHTSYRHNYGHYFVIMDWLFGTLATPEEFAAGEVAAK